MERIKSKIARAVEQKENTFNEEILSIVPKRNEERANTKCDANLKSNVLKNNDESNVSKTFKETKFNEYTDVSKRNSNNLEDSTKNNIIYADVVKTQNNNRCVAHKERKQ